MAILKGITFTISVPGWADGKDGDTGIDIIISNSNGIPVADFSKNGDSEWPIDKNQSYSDSMRVMAADAQLDKQYLQRTTVIVNKVPDGNDSVTFDLVFQFSYDDGSKQLSGAVSDLTQEAVFRMTEGEGQTIGKNFIAHQ